MTCEQKDSSKLIAVHGSSLRLSIRGQGHVPSFKNRKRAILDSATGKMRTLTEPRVKKWMTKLENAIESELYSLSQTEGNGTPSECLRQLRTALSGLCDDSIREIPNGEWRVEYVARGDEGLIIEITLI